MCIMDSFANMKQLFPNQYLETLISEVAEKLHLLADVVPQMGSYRVPQENKERFHRMPQLLGLLRKLCFPHVAEQTQSCSQNFPWETSFISLVDWLFY